MIDEFEHPELAGYEPIGEPRARSRRTVVALRVVVIVGILALVLPETFTIVTVGAANAQRACHTWVKYAVPDAESASARFELFGPKGVGYECYAIGAFGGDRHVASLGLIPGPAMIPAHGVNG
jgi:hypothetical protein